MESAEPKVRGRSFQENTSFRLIKRGIGRDLPQEVPREFVEAIIDVAEV